MGSRFSRVCGIIDAKVVHHKPRLVRYHIYGRKSGDTTDIDNCGVGIKFETQLLLECVCVCGLKFRPVWDLRK